MPESHRVVVVGAGPAGLAACHGLLSQRTRPLILDKASRVGGISRTEQHQGFLFDMGGHRFLTDLPEIQALWEQTLGPELLRVRRRSRILYQGRWYRYPLELGEVLAKLGVGQSLVCLGSYLAAQFTPRDQAADFESWLIRCFGRRLYEHFFKHYTEKIWGLSCRRLEADWAEQRIPGLSLVSALKHALRLGDSGPRSLADQFYYPRLGAGMMWERLLELIVAQGAQCRLDSRVLAISHHDRRVQSIQVRGPDGVYRLKVGHLLSSLPLPGLLAMLDPPPPPEVMRAAQGIRFRSFIEVALILAAEQLFDDQWVYIHDPQMKVGRVQNFMNWSADMVPQTGRLSLGMEYFCSHGDEMWRMSDQEMTSLAVREMETLWPGLAGKTIEARVYRFGHAYPVYDAGYRQPLGVIMDYLAQFRNLRAIGRNGLHRYINMDQAMWSGLRAARELASQELA